MYKLALSTVLAAALAASLIAGTAAALPAGFALESVGSGWNEAVGITFAADGRMYVWERGGRIWHAVAIAETGTKRPLARG